MTDARVYQEASEERDVARIWICPVVHKLRAGSAEDGNTGAADGQNES